MKIYIRILIDLFVLFFAISGYWPYMLIIGFIGLVYFDWYFEIIFAGLIFDLLFGANSALGKYSYIMSIVTSAVFVFYLLLNKILRK